MTTEEILTDIVLTSEDVLAQIVKAEGGFQDSPNDRGNRGNGATNFGITAKTLGEWRRLGRPATRAEVQALTLAESQDIYRARYVQPFASVPFDELRAHLIDVAVLSGVYAAIKLLQGVLGVPVDGVLGERTRTALGLHDWRLVNNALVGARVRLFVEIVRKDPTQKAWLFGWCQRAVGFLRV